MVIKGCGDSQAALMLARKSRSQTQVMDRGPGSPTRQADGGTILPCLRAEQGDALLESLPLTRLALQAAGGPRSAAGIASLRWVRWSRVALEEAGVGVPPPSQRPTPTPSPNPPPAGGSHHGDLHA